MSYGVAQSELWSRSLESCKEGTLGVKTFVSSMKLSKSQDADTSSRSTIAVFGQ